MTNNTPDASTASELKEQLWYVLSKELTDENGNPTILQKSRILLTLEVNEIMQLFAAERARLFELVRKEVIGEDIAEPKYYGSLTENELKRKMRIALSKLEKEES